MQSILYISEETQPFSTSDLRELLQKSSSKNRDMGVTGYLHHESGIFLQYIEGSTAAVCKTMEHINQDRRHRVFYRAEQHDLDQRRFPDWDMHWEDRDTIVDSDTEISALARTLEPFEQLQNNAGLNRVFSLYKQVAYDHVLREMVISRKKNDQLIDTLSMAVHDLRSPVRAVRSLIEMYTIDAGKNIDPNFTEISEFIGGTLNRMDALIDDVLVHFETDAPSVTEWVDTALVVKEISASTKLLDKNHEVISLGELPKIRANPLGIWRVFNCLITNGLKYNQSGNPRVEITAETIGPDWQFCVRDNGIGVDANDQQRIFEMFQRLHSQSAYAGSGVGLATCRKLVEQWQGKIWLSSSESEGSQFYFTYPA